MDITKLESALITHAQGLLENAFPQADPRWIAGASRLQVLGDRAGLTDQEKSACQAVLGFMELGQRGREQSESSTRAI